MRASASLFLALRYLRPQKSIVTIITLLSIIGPILGVATLVVVTSVMEGMGREIRSRIFGMQTHLQVKSVDTDGYVSDPKPIMEALKAHGLRATPTTEGPVLIQIRRDIQAKLLRGVDPESDAEVTIIQQNLVAGRMPEASGEVAIGEQLAFQFGLGVGSRLVVHPTGKLKKMVTVDEDDEVMVEGSEDYQPSELSVVGVFKVGMYDFDSSYLLVDLASAAEMFALPEGAVGEVRAVADDPFAVLPLVKELQSDPRLAGYTVLTWEEANKQLFDALRVEKTVQFFVLTLIVVVAAFSIMAMLITVVIRKQPEIGVMKAMGATPWTILRIFVYQGAMVGFMGVLGGTLAGGGVLAIRNKVAYFLHEQYSVQILPMPTPEIPAVIQVGDILIIGLIAFVICLLAAVLPALYAATMSPTKALTSGGG